MLRRTRVENGELKGLPGADPRITAFKGIPFAAPPVGKNRWKAPQPCENWEGVRTAYEFGPISMQDTLGIGEGGMTGNNMWTPISRTGRITGFLSPATDPWIAMMTMCQRRPLAARLSNSCMKRRIEHFGFPGGWGARSFAGRAAAGMISPKRQRGFRDEEKMVDTGRSGSGFDPCRLGRKRGTRRRGRACTAPDGLFYL